MSRMRQIPVMDITQREKMIQQSCASANAKCRAACADELSSTGTKGTCEQIPA